MLFGVVLLDIQTNIMDAIISIGLNELIDDIKVKIDFTQNTINVINQIKIKNESKKERKNLAIAFYTNKMMSHKTEKLIIETIIKQNVRLLPILKARYADHIVEVMFNGETLVKQNIIEERLYKDICEECGAKSILINQLIDLTCLVVASEIKEEEEQHEESEEQAPEPIYDVDPNATDVEICAFFTNIQS